MLKNYIKIAWRNLVKGKIYSIINITGLAVGIACCLLIGLYVYEELRFDRFHENADRIYRVNHVFDIGERSSIDAQTPIPLGQLLEERYPEVEEVTSMHRSPSSVIRIDNQLYEEDFLVTGPSFFEVFDFNVLQGNPAESLLAPDEVFLTEGAAENFFGTADVVGRAIELRIDGTFYAATVAGIVEDPPQYSSIQFRILVPDNLWNRADPGFERNSNWNTLRGVRYVLLEDQAEIESLAHLVVQDINELTGGDFGDTRSFEFQPLTGIHLGESVQGGLEPTANAAFIYIAVLVAALVLLIACINFTSLSIGHSIRRAREVGMRKALGARRSQLIAQFWGEALMVMLASLCIGLLVAEFMLPYFGNLVNRQLELNPVGNPMLAVIVLGILLLSALLAGSYPALYLSRFRPSTVFRSKIFEDGNYSLVRILTGVQFTLAATLIVGTLFMNRQMKMMAESNPGFDEDYLIQMDVPFEEGEQIMVGLRTRMESEPSVRMISGAWNGLAGSSIGFGNSSPLLSQDEEVRGFTFGVDPVLPELLELTLLEGSFFNNELDSPSSNEVLVNRELMQAFGWDEPIGKTLTQMYTQFGSQTVVGVVENFNFQSMHHPIGPLAIHTNSPIATIYTRIDGNNISRALGRLEEAWQEVAPELPFNFAFLDEQIEQQYQVDRRWAEIVGLASGLVIIISCMGLFGLATMASVKRAKEVGIRKVLGATVASVTTLLSKDFLKPVGVGLIIAVPLSYLLINRWLADFAYRIDLDAGTFILAGLITVLIALVTVSWQSVRAALANPVESLRSE